MTLQLRDSFGNKLSFSSGELEVSLGAPEGLNLDSAEHTNHRLSVNRRYNSRTHTSFYDNADSAEPRHKIILQALVPEMEKRYRLMQALAYERKHPILGGLLRKWYHARGKIPEYEK